MLDCVRKNFQGKCPQTQCSFSGFRVYEDRKVFRGHAQLRASTLDYLHDY